MNYFLQLILLAALLLATLISCNDQIEAESVILPDAAIRVSTGDQVRLAETPLYVVYNGPTGVDYFTFEVRLNQSVSSVGLASGQTAVIGPDFNYLLAVDEAEQAAVTIRLSQEIKLGSLAFADETTAVAYDLFQHCTASAPSAAGTVHPPRRNISFVSAKQCDGPGAPAGCDYTDLSRESRGFNLINLDAEYLAGNPQSFVGVWLRAISLPENAGWGSQISYRDKSYDSEPAGWQLNFTQFDSSGQATMVIRLGETLTYQLNDTAIYARSDPAPLQSLTETLSSPAALQATGEQLINELLNNVRAQANSGTQICAPVTPTDDTSTAPECIYREATAAETEQALQQAEGELTAQLEALKANSVTLHAAANALLPFTECSP